MDIQDRYYQEPVAITVSFCAMDAGNGKGGDPAEIWRQAERYFCRAIVEEVGSQLSEAIDARVSAESGDSS